MNYISNVLEKFEEFINRMCLFSLRAKSKSEIDTSPNNLIVGSIGDILVKNKNIIQYKSINSNEFINMSAYFPELTKKNESILSNGINKYATWTYTIDGWKLAGYVCKELNNNCCFTNKSILKESQKNIPSITWNNPNPITYGDILTNEQLNAQSDVYGTFKYEPDFGTVLLGGQHTLKTYFTPNNTESYASVTSSVQINVNKILSDDPHYSLTWNTPNPITYGDLLSDVQLNAIAKYKNNEVYGRYIYTPSKNAKLSGGTHTLTVIFIPNTTACFDTLTQTVQLEVNKLDPILIWPEIEPLKHGESLSDIQLNAYVYGEPRGEFTYDPNFDTILASGKHSITATFTPNENYSNNYNAVSISNDIYITAELIYTLVGAQTY